MHPELSNVNFHEFGARVADFLAVARDDRLHFCQLVRHAYPSLTIFTILAVREAMLAALRKSLE